MGSNRGQGLGSHRPHWPKNQNKTETNSIKTLQTGLHKNIIIIITGLSGWRKSKYLPGFQQLRCRLSAPAAHRGPGRPVRHGSLPELQQQRKPAEVGCVTATRVQGVTKSLKAGAPALSHHAYKSGVKKSTGQMPCHVAYLLEILKR